jgi:peptide deformylase
VAVREILLLGNPKLYELSESIVESELDLVRDAVEDLNDTMMAFKAQYGRGRAIAAPQIGVMKRLVYMHIDHPHVFINPVLVDKSSEMIELWDDCMSFPDIVVLVRRHRTCTVVYRDMDWREQRLELRDDLSELLQHEVDHLDGVLAVQRAIDDRSIAMANQILRRGGGLD